jgi:hypothetical protein
MSALALLAFSAATCLQPEKGTDAKTQAVAHPAGSCSNLNAVLLQQLNKKNKKGKVS